MIFCVMKNCIPHDTKPSGGDAQTFYALHTSCGDLWNEYAPSCGAGCNQKKILHI